MVGPNGKTSLFPQLPSKSKLIEGDNILKLSMPMTGFYLQAIGPVLPATQIMAPWYSTNGNHYLEAGGREYRVLLARGYVRLRHNWATNVIIGQKTNARPMAGLNFAISF